MDSLLLYLLHHFLSSLIEAGLGSEGVCKTTAGDRCQFPFTFGEKTYKECTTVKNTVPWCRTQKSWGECAAGCPGSAASVTTTITTTTSTTHTVFFNPTAIPTPSSITTATGTTTAATSYKQTTCTTSDQKVLF